jgi:hypothetical protein
MSDNSDFIELFDITWDFTLFIIFKEQERQKERKKE